MRVEMRLFRHVPHALLVGDRVILDGYAIEQDLARAGLDEAGDYFHRGRFAGAIGSEVARDFTGMRRETDVIDGDRAGETFGNIAKFQHKASTPHSSRNAVSGSMVA